MQAIEEKVEQGSEAWFRSRCGKVSASKMADVIKTLAKGGETAAYAAYKMKLVSERLTGIPENDGYVSREMQWGTDHEPEARAEYELASGNLVDQVAFIDHAIIPNFGASPDGTIKDDGLLEIKCPASSTHLRWIIDGVVPEQHQAQMLTQMACTGRQWCQFVSFDPRMPEKLQLFIKRFERDNKRIAELEDAAIKLNSEVDAIVAELLAIA
jgi:putative phage-type endonuclease